MKIVQITSMHNSNDVRIYVRSVSELRNQGINCIYIASNDKKIESTNIDILIPLRKSIFRRLFTSIQAIYIGSKQKGDILHFHDPEFLAFSWIPKIYGKKVIYDIHEYYYVKFQFGGYFKRVIGKRLFMLYEMFGFMFVDGLITVSQSIKDKYTYTNKPIEVVRNVPLRRSTIEIERDFSSNSLDVYISGNHSEQRNCSNIIHALKYIEPIKPEIKVNFIGKYSPNGYIQLLQELAKELKVEKMITFSGMLSYEENLKMASKAGVGLVLYEDNINNRVGIPNRLFEYMSVGLPIIAEDFPELKKIVKFYNCGICLDSSNPKNLANGIIELFDDNKKLQEMGVNGKKAIQSDLNFENEIKKMILLYNIILN